MRTIEQFQKIWADLDWMHRNHNKPFWLVARENDYCLSVVEPSPAALRHVVNKNTLTPEFKQ